MNEISIEIALNNTICTCCLNRGSVKDVYENYTHLDVTENYSEMLKECFGILLIPEESPRNGICKICINRLRNACDFKEQVLDCQEQLREFVKSECYDTKSDIQSEDESENSGNEISVPLQDKMKVEATECSSQDIGEVEYLDDDLDMDYGDNVVLKVTGNSDSDYDPDDEQNDNAGTVALRETRQTNKVAEKKGVTEDIQRAVSLKNKKSKTCLNGESIKKEAKKSSLKRVKPRARFQRNFKNFIKYSNATPFTKRTIRGYTCAFCDDVCKTMQELRQHVNTNHADEVNMQNYKKQKSVKMDVTNLTCKLCDTEVNSLKELKLHFREHKIEMYDDTYFMPEFKFENDKEFKCVFCERDFETYMSLYKHINKHYDNFVCHVCGTGFVAKQRLKAHIKTHDVGEYQCTFCKKVFETKLRRDSHEHYHKKPKRIKCTHCDETFNKYPKRNKHMQLVHNDLQANYKCTMCNQQFWSGNTLSLHVRKYHLMERNYVCSYCDKEFFEKRYLTRHLVKHTGEKNYKCRFCGKDFGRQRNLVEHERIHTNDRRYKCQVCGAAFVQISSLKGHMLTNHSKAKYKSTNKDTEEKEVEETLSEDE